MLTVPKIRPRQTVQLDTLNPKVKEIIEAAVKASKPFWATFTSGAKEVLPRLPVYLEPAGGSECLWLSANELKWLVQEVARVDGCVMALTKNSLPFTNGPIKQTYHDLRVNDTLIVSVGGLEYIGKLPPHDD